MARTVFVLGAGASRDADGPLMADFIQKAQDAFRRNAVPWARDAFKLVFDARTRLQQVHVASRMDLDNIEHLFAAFEMAGLLERLGSMPAEQVVKLPIAMRRMITATLEATLKFPVKDGQVQAPHCYAAFVRLLHEINRKPDFGPIAVITFNYDLALDYALHLSGRKYTYGLDDSRDPDSLDVMKLHGSLNWFQPDPQSPVILATSLSPVTAKGQDSDGVNVSLRSMLQLETDECDPVIVPPTWNKAQYHLQFRTIWRRAAQHLSEAENIIAIGYSLPESDYFFHYLYALSTIRDDTMLERFWTIGPNVGHNYKRILGSIVEARKLHWHSNVTFAGMYQEIVPRFGLKQELQGILSQMAHGGKQLFA